MTRISQNVHVVKTLLRLSASILLVSGQNTVPCPAEPDLMGYISIQDLNADMQHESDAIVAGNKTAEELYMYHLCPNTEFIISQDDSPLKPILPKVSILCGLLGESSKECTIKGGNVQVSLVEASVAGVNEYDIEEVTIMGVTFSDSTFSSVKAEASDLTTLTLHDCHWTENTGKAMIIISRRASTDNDPPLDGENKPSMTASIQKCTIMNNYNPSSGDYVIIGSKGVLYMEEVTIADNSADYVVETLSGGASTLKNVEFKGNNATVIVRSIGGSFIDISETAFVENTASASVAAISANVEAQKLLFEDNTNQIAHVTTLSGGNFDIDESCFLGGESQMLVFVDAVSKYKGTSLHRNEVSTSYCDGAFVEVPANVSTCTTEPAKCEGVCKQDDFSMGYCGYYPSPTQTPTASPTVTPTTEAPTAIPTTAVPSYAPTSSTPSAMPSQGGIGGDTSAASTIIERNHQAKFVLFLVSCSTLWAILM